MRIARKRKVAFPVLMWIVTTGVIPFAILAVTVRILRSFPRVRLRAWGASDVALVATILLVGRPLQSLVDRLGS